MPPWLASALISIFSAVGAALPAWLAPHAPVPPVGAPRKPGFDDIERAEDAAAAKRTGPKA
jgi:hypothetical protein